MTTTMMTAKTTAATPLRSLKQCSLKQSDFLAALLFGASVLALAILAAAPASGQGWDPDPWDDDRRYHDDGTVCEHDHGYHEDSYGDRDRDRDWDRYGRRGDRRDSRVRELRRGEGVVIFSEDYFEGRSTLFSSDVRDLNGTYVGNDTASSILVAPGCKVTLYEHQDYRGRSVELSRDLADLGDTRLRDDRLSSLRLDCRGGWDSDWDHDGGHGGGSSREIVLFEHQNFTGKSRVVNGDVTDLNRLYMNDLVTSIQVPRGCEVILYEHQAYRGKSYRLTHDITDLNRVDMNDLITSLRLDCRGGGWGDHGGQDHGGPPDTRGQIVLFEHKNFTGKSRVVTGDVTDLNRLYMNDLVTSIQVPSRCQVVLYEHKNFTGRSYRLDYDIPDLNRVSMNDLITSLRVECRRGR